MTDIRMSPEVAGQVRGRFSDLSAEFTNSVRTVAEIVTSIEIGTGEFGKAIADGTGAFDISWREAFAVCGTTSAVIAGNTNRLSIDLDALDRSAGTSAQL